MKSRNLANNNALLWVLCAILAVSYVLPWLSSQSSALTLGAYDLAEWTSLHPEVVNSSPSLLVPLLLRLIPVLLVFLITINVPSRNRLAWWIGIFFVIAEAIAMFPPLEFIISERGNINHRQMFAISAGTLILGGIGLSGVLYQFRLWLTSLIALVGLLCTGIAMSQAFQLYADFYLPRNIGIGAILTGMIFTAIIVRSAWRVIKQ